MRTHYGVSRAPLMGFKAHLADDMTNPGNVKTLERTIYTQFPSALVASQMHYKTRPGHVLSTENEEESTTAWTRPKLSGWQPE